MKWWRRLRRRTELEDRLEAELRFHFDRMVDDKVQKGLSIADARRAARLEFGGLEQVKEECREARGTLWLEFLWRDIRFALRMLRKSPGFALAAVGTLALAIGANTAIFSAVYATLLKPLPFKRPAELVTVSIDDPHGSARFRNLPLTAWVFEEFRRASTSFAGMAALKGTEFNLTGKGAPEHLYGARVSANFFDLLGVAPARGRAFLPEEDTPGRDGVVLISQELWMRRFGGDLTILNHPIQLDGRNVLVIGILPAGFLAPTGTRLHPLMVFGPRIDVWKPIAFSQDELQSYQNFQFAAVARLRSRVSIAQARDELSAIVSSASRRFGGDGDIGVQVRPLHDAFSGDVREGLVVLLGAVVLLLLIGCVNLANLLLARMSKRDREFAMRAALGAPRGRLVRQILTESLVISLFGGVAGLFVAWCVVHLLISLAPAHLTTIQGLHLNAPVLLFTLTTSLATAVAFGLLPGIDAARRTLPERTAGLPSGAGRSQRMLVTVEVVLCTGLLAVAGLLLHSFVRVMNVDKGFAVERVLSADLELPQEDYTPARIVTFYAQLLERIRALPGVITAGAATAPPLLPQAYNNSVHAVTDRGSVIKGLMAACNDVTSGYFETMGISLLGGRFFTESEPAEAVIASAALARGLWPDQPVSRAVGQRIRMGGREETLYRIVGVVGDVYALALDRPPQPMLYLPHKHEPSASMSVVLRTTVDPRTLGPAVRAVVGGLDPTLPVGGMHTMRQIVSSSVAQRRFELVLVMLFAVLAVFLAVIGIYAVTAYSVARQTREIGLRMALGAQPSELIRSMLLQGLRPVLAGLAIGMVVAILGAMAIRRFLFGTGPLDPVALVGVAVILLVAGALACYLPARRASLLDPILALRLE
ncbi:MAG: ABC transporter permease [Acidobacteriota bacterium]